MVIYGKIMYVKKTMSEGEEWMDNTRLPTDKAKEKSLVISYLRAIAIILVIIHHSMSYGIGYIGEPGGVYMGFLEVINCVHVPLFFMISGYLCRAQSVSGYYRKKLLHILVPFFVFSSVKLAYNLMFEGFGHSDSVGGEFLSAYVFGEYYWFSYALMLMFLAAPLLWKIKSKVGLIATLSGVLVVNITGGFLDFLPQGEVFQIDRAFVFSSWFLFGYVLKQLDAKRVFEDKKWKNILLVASVLISVPFVFLYTGGYLNNFLGKFVLSLSLSYPLLYGVSFIKVRISALDMISKYSYQLFLLDSFVKVILFALLSKILPVNLPVIILIAILNIALSTLACDLIRRIKYVRLLIGLN